MPDPVGLCPKVGTTEDAVKAAEAALDDARHLAEEVRALQLLDRYDEAATPLRRKGDDPALVHARMWQDVNLGRLDEVEAQAHTLIRLSDELGDHVGTLDAGSVLAFTALVRGDFAEARARLDTNSRPGPDDAALRATAVRLMRGWISLLEGDPDQAAADYRPLLATALTSREYWPWFPLWTLLFTQVGLAVGDRAFAADAAALADHGTALLTTDRDRAVARLEDARRVYDHVGALLPAAALERTLAAAGVAAVRPARRGPRPRTGWDALTDAERTVADLVGAGHTNRSAATELGVSANTVGTHVRSIFTKLDVRSRVRLANLLHHQEQQC